jgi:hypothetical protein
MFLGKKCIHKLRFECFVGLIFGLTDRCFNFVGQEELSIEKTTQKSRYLTQTRVIFKFIQKALKKINFDRKK